MDIIKDKLIFNVEKLTPGTAIRFKYTIPIGGKFINGIILRSYEDALEIVQFDNSTKDNTFKNKLHIKSVIESKLKIEVLK